MNITKVKAPMFYVGTEWINEYELRTLMLEVSRGEHAGEYLVVLDIDGNDAMINSTGHLTARLEGMSLSDNLAIDLFNTTKNR